MAKIVTAWLNDELQLSRRVNEFEKDFANGYLFGENLFKLGLQTVFKDFKDQDNPTAGDVGQFLTPGASHLRRVCICSVIRRNHPA